MWGNACDSTQGSKGLQVFCKTHKQWTQAINADTNFMASEQKQ